MRLVNDRLAVKAKMLTPNHRGYILLAAEVDKVKPFGRPSPAKRQLLKNAKTRLNHLAQQADVLDATLFRAVLIAPGEGIELIKARSGKVHHARYDIVILVRTTNIESARMLRENPEYKALSSAVRQDASYTMELIACNAVRLGDVDHRLNDVFLFNYFYADNNADLIPVFEYTAGWFQAKTGLPNSILLKPLEGEATDNGIINHASWPNFRAFLPSLLFRPTFRSFVLANFAANKIAAQPILYRRV
jgi:hypothetical protein